MLINTQFRRLWYGQTISVIGDSIFDTTLLLWLSSILLAGKSYAPAVSSALIVLVSVTSLVIGPIAGVYVDRYDKRNIMLRSDTIRAALMILLAVIAFLGRSVVPLVPQLVVIGIVVIAATGVAQFFSPARFAVIRDVVPEEHRGKASSYQQTGRSVAMLIGPPIAAGLLLTVGYKWALVIDAVSFMVSYVAIRSVRMGLDTEAAPATVEPIVTAEPTLASTEIEPEPAPAATPAEPPSKKSFKKEFADGLRFVGGNRILVTLIVSIVFITLAAGVLNALEVYFVPDNLHASPAWYGGLVAAAGAGTLIGSLIGGRLGDRFGLEQVFKGSLLLFGVTFLVYSRMTNVWPTLFLSILFGLSLGSLNTALFPIILKHAPKELLGRVMAVVNPVSQAASMASVALAGVLVGTVMRNFHATVAGIHFGKIDTIFLFGGVCAIIAGLYSLKSVPNERKVTVEAPVQAMSSDLVVVGQAQDEPEDQAPVEAS